MLSHIEYYLLKIILSIKILTEIAYIIRITKITMEIYKVDIINIKPIRKKDIGKTSISFIIPLSHLSSFIIHNKLIHNQIFMFILKHGLGMDQFIRKYLSHSEMLNLTSTKNEQKKLLGYWFFFQPIKVAYIQISNIGYPESHHGKTL